MLRVIHLLCFVPATLSIIIRDPPPSPNDYKYSYNIDDPTTGDSKSQHEVRQGDVVSGAYTVLGPDGTKRTVEYTADPKHGFKATIREDNVMPAITQPFLNQNYNSIQYQNGIKPVYTSVPPAKPRSDYVAAKPVVYFTPQKVLKTRTTFDGQYFIPVKRN